MTRMLREAQVLERFGISRATLWRGMKDGRYPKPVKIGLKRIAWVEEEIEGAIQRAIAASREAA